MDIAPWEIKDIQVNIDNEGVVLFSKFTIYDESNLIKFNKTTFCKKAETNDYIGEMKGSQIETGIMVSNLKIKSRLIYLLIFDNRIFIIKHTNLQRFQEYFNEHLDSLLFMSAKCKQNFFNSISLKKQISKHHHHFLIEEADIKNEIIRCIIKKSQYRTIKMRHEILPEKYNSKNDQNYELSDFVSIFQSQRFKLYYNSKDQILNVLKSYEDEKKFNHEINFYHQIENTFPFIRKIFGIIKQIYGLPIIILEYVEGDTLTNFILNRKKNIFNTKIKIIVEILFSVFYIYIPMDYF